jgi:hypothetical protein
VATVSDYYPGEYRPGHHVHADWIGRGRAGKTYLQSRLLAELEGRTGTIVVSPAGFLRAWRDLPAAITNLQRDPDDPFDPAGDPPFTLVDRLAADDYWVRARRLAAP